MSDTYYYQSSLFWRRIATIYRYCPELIDEIDSALGTQFGGLTEAVSLPRIEGYNKIIMPYFIKAKAKHDKERDE